MKHREEKDFYTVKELADLLSLAERTIREWLEHGEVKGVKFVEKGPWRIPSAEVDRLLTGRKPVEKLVDLATQLKAQLATPAPETIPIDDLGGPGRYTIAAKRDLFRLIQENSAEDANVITVVHESWTSIDVEINIRVLPGDTLELFCPVEENPLFPSLLSSLSQGAQEQFTVWKQQGGDYFQRRADIHWEIAADAREQALQLLNKAATQGFPADNFLTADFSDLVYQRSVLYYRTGGRVDIPHKKLYRISRLSQTLYGLYLLRKYLARAPSPHSPSPPDILGHLADLHRDKIVKWSVSPAITELVELFESLCRIERAIKEELSHLYGIGLQATPP